MLSKIEVSYVPLLIYKKKYFCSTRILLWTNKLNEIIWEFSSFFTYGIIGQEGKPYRLHLVSPFHFFAVLSGIIRGLILLVVKKKNHSFNCNSWFCFLIQMYRILVSFSVKKVSDRSNIFYLFVSYVRVDFLI